MIFPPFAHDFNLKPPLYHGISTCQAGTLFLYPPKDGSVQSIVAENSNKAMAGRLLEQFAVL
jgi:hypothetical protein